METVGKHWRDAPSQQALRGMPLTVPDLHEADVVIVQRMTDVGAMRYAVQRSGRDDYEIAEKLDISPGYMSKVLKGTAGLYGKRLVRFMHITNSLAPLQWYAEQMGCRLALVPIKSEADRRIEALEAHIASLEAARQGAHA